MYSFYVKKLQLSFKKTGLIPGKAPSEAEQREFIRQIDYHSQQKETVLLFFDACHLLHNAVNARMWQPSGKKGTIAIKSNTGRKRINILGALDIADLSTHITLTEETCNAERVIQFLQKVRDAYPDAKIVFVLDNICRRKQHLAAILTTLCPKFESYRKIVEICKEAFGQ